MPSYLRRAATPRVTPQSEPIPGSTQVENEAGGHVWKLDPIARLRRWLILGSEGGTYYASERKLTRQNIDCLNEAFDKEPVRALSLICKVSAEGLAPKPDQAIYALAVACAHKETALRREALHAIPLVCRTGTHLFMFCEFVQQQRGWGRGLRKGVGAWYDKEPEALAYQLVKYRQRNGWTHRDVLRLAHPELATQNPLLHWVTKGDVYGGLTEKPLLAHLQAMKSASAKETAMLLNEYGNSLPREAINPEHLDSPEVWSALLEQGMPMTALIRNLGNLSKVGVITPFSNGAKLAVGQIRDTEHLRKAKVHPIQILLALATYSVGRGLRGSGTWQPVAQIVEALDDAFDKSFQFVEPTGKRHLLALDVSSSMTSQMGSVPLTCRAGAAAMAMTIARSEPEYGFMGFCDRLVPLDITAKDSLRDVVVKTDGLPFGGTDAAIPMVYAKNTGLPVDVFVILTDSETWAGQIHPVQALADYRRASGIDAKLIVVAMTSAGFTIADPNDAGMLDVVGFDASAPRIMADFARGSI